MIRECFKNTDFRVLWGAGCMTGIARAMEFLALSLYALQELGIPYLVTVIFAARMLPMSLLGIVIGTISERVSPILVIKIIYSLSNIFTGMAVILVFTDNFNMFFAFTLAFINGITWVVDLAVRRRVLADNIKKKLLSSSLAMETLSNNATRLIGPLCAGTLYTFVGLTGIFSLQFLMYLLALGLIIRFKNNTNKDIILNSPPQIPLAIKEHWAHGLLDEILKTGKSVSQIISDLDLGNVSDESELLKIIDKIISDESEAVEQAKSNPQTINYLVGKVMQATKGKADPTSTLNLLKKQIGI